MFRRVCRLVTPSAAAIALIPEEEICQACVEDNGLCHAEHCRRSVLPQLAKPALVRLIGDTHTEQKKRQISKPEQTAIEKIKRRNARKVARSQRRGMYGLLKAIKGIA